jgi:hypothetical protein
MSVTAPHLHILIPAERLCIDALASHSLASVRMRCALAARAATFLGWHVSVGENPLMVPDVLLVGKIGAHQIAERTAVWLELIKRSTAKEKTVCLDYTDNHCGFDGPMTGFYRSAIGIVTTVITPSVAMNSALRGWWAGHTWMIPDPYEVEPQAPRNITSGPWRALWFGAPANLTYLCSFLESSANTDNIQSLTIVTNAVGRRLFLDWVQPNLGRRRIPRVTYYDWSVANLEAAARHSDIAIIPSDATDQRKLGVSENRLITALMLGLPTIATPMPSYRLYAKFFIALQTGWSGQLLSVNNQHDSICEAQALLRERFSPRTLQHKWKDLLQTERLTRDLT